MATAPALRSVGQWQPACQEIGQAADKGVAGPGGIDRASFSAGMRDAESPVTTMLPRSPSVRMTVPAPRPAARGRPPRTAPATTRRGR